MIYKEDALVDHSVIETIRIENAIVAKTDYILL